MGFLIGLRVQYDTEFVIFVILVMLFNSVIVILVYSVLVY